jgi:tetratricopeptide (TPR) repeat protein
LFAAIRQNKKFIHAPQSEFYDFEKDPAEAKNMVKQSNVADWQRAAQSYAKSGMGEEENAMPAEEQEKLRSLGYVSGQVSRTGADPKDKIQIMERFRLGMVMLKKQQYVQAESRFREIMATETHNGLAFRFLGDALSAQQKYGEAAQAYASSIERMPDPDVFVQLAKAHNRSGQTSKAEQILLDAIRIFPAYQEASFELASLYASRKNWDAALAILKGDGPEYHNQRGLIYIGRKNVPQAVNEFRSALRKQEKATYWNNLGIAYQQSGEAGAAEKAYVRAIELDPDYAEADANLSFLLISIRRWQEAGEHLQKIVSRNSQLWRARMALAYVREMQGRRSEAIEVYRNLLKDAPPSWPERAQAETRLKALTSE